MEFRLFGVETSTMAIQQTLEELKQHLEEQKSFLRDSAAAYDAGKAAEAKRMANALRILFYDFRQSVSLFSQIGLKDSVLMFDLAGEAPGPQTAIFIPLTQTFGQEGVKYLANFDLAPKRQIAFDQWWSATVYRHSAEGLEFSRSRLVLDMRDKDGGGHVDPALKDDYAKIARIDRTYQMLQGSEIIETTTSGPAGALIRQITAEVLLTLGDPPAPPRKFAGMRIVSLG